MVSEKNILWFSHFFILIKILADTNMVKSDFHNNTHKHNYYPTHISTPKYIGENTHTDDQINRKDNQSKSHSVSQSINQSTSNMHSTVIQASRQLLPSFFIHKHFFSYKCACVHFFFVFSTDLSRVLKKWMKRRYSKIEKEFPIIAQTVFV